MPRERYDITLSTHRLLEDGLTHSAAEHPHLEGHRLRLAELTARADVLLAQRNALESQKQTATRELQGVLAEVRLVGSFLRAGLRQQHGTGSERLVEFGMQPRRRRARARAKPATEE